VTIFFFPEPFSLFCESDKILKNKRNNKLICAKKLINRSFNIVLGDNHDRNGNGNHGKYNNRGTEKKGKIL